LNRAVRTELAAVGITDQVITKVFMLEAGDHTFRKIM
jgi:hypothetical protein